MLRRHVLAVVVLCLTAGCDSRSDREKLQGEWKMRAMYGWFEFDLPAVKGGPSIITFSDDTFTFQNGEGPRHRVGGTFACDATKSPNQITLKYDGRTVVGIYCFSVGTLRICVGKDDKEPPGEFHGGPGDRPALLIFERRTRK